MLRSRMFLSTVWLCMALIYGTHGAKTMMFKAVHNAAVEGDPVDTAHDVVSNIDCARKCDTYYNCDVISYDRVTKACRLFSWLDLTLVSKEPAEKVWRHPSIRMVSARYHDNREMTFLEAGQLCRDFGGNLTTVIGIYGVKGDTVFDMCRCGWVSEQASIRLLVQSVVNCPPANNAGVNVCYDVVTTPYAWCTFV